MRPASFPFQDKTLRYGRVKRFLLLIFTKSFSEALEKIITSSNNKKEDVQDFESFKPSAVS